MDWNLNTPTEWDWENLPFSSQENVGFSSFSTSSSKEGIKTFGGLGYDDLPKDFLEKEDESCWLGENGSFNSNMVEEANSVLSGEAMIGLKLMMSNSSRNNNNNNNNSNNNKTVASNSTMIKRSRASYLNSQSPRCQVEGCNLDLTSSKDYHRRHRICASHSKSPKVVVAGMERRFCQQCSRFHDLSEFDDRKRSCRRRLSAHNARRRRPQSEEIHFTSTRISSSSSSISSDRRPHVDFLLNRDSIPILDSAPPKSSRNFKGEECLIGLAKGGGIDVLATNSALSFGSERLITPRHANHNGMEPTPNSNSNSNSNSILSGDIRINAFSLLSTSSWSSSWPEEPDQFVHANSITSTSQTRVPLELQNTTNNTQLQDIRSFRSPHEFEHFYSN